jgi:hypothetical protein
MNKLLPILLLACATAFAQSSAWKDGKGNPVPDSPAQKSIKDFGGWLMVTPDANWEEKWNTPASAAPSFTAADEVKRGDRVFVLIFFVNPKPDKNGSADVTCDLEVARPDKTISTKESGVVCFAGKLEGPPYNIRLAGPVIGFVGEPSDPAGKWIVRVVLKDNVRQVAIPLETSFELK